MQAFEKYLGDWKALFMYPASLFGIDFIQIEMTAKIILWTLAIIAGVLNVMLLMRKWRKK